MTQPKIALFFAILFSAFILTPSVLMIADQDCDLAIYFNGAEEEEKKGNESPKDAEDKILNDGIAVEEMEYKENNKSFYHYCALHPDEFIQIISPPPETLL